MTTAPDESFSYQKLGPDDIRLLRFTGYGHSHAILNFDIRHWPRESAPPYTALSYEWRGTNNPLLVILNGRKFEVRANLWWCLLHVVRFEGIEYLWADAICIDQSTALERNDQVRRMDQTYRNAVKVIAWLGPEFEVRSSEVQIAKVAASNIRQDRCLPDMLRYQSYWSRTWIIQELLLAKEVHFLYGLECANWLDLIKRYRVVTALEFSLDESVEAVAPLAIGGGSKEEDRTLINILILSHNSMCEDPRDRVFAILGLLPDQDREILGHFFPDYTMSVGKVQLLMLAYVRHLWFLNARRRQHSPYRIPICPKLEYRFLEVWRQPLGIKSHELGSEFLSEIERCTEFHVPIQRKRAWSLKFLIQFCVWERSTCAIRQRREEVALHHQAWVQYVKDDLQALASVTTR